MKFKIIGDSCTEFQKNDLKKEYVKMAPLTITVDDVDVVDDENLSHTVFLAMLDNMKSPVKTACPSPDSYIKYFDDAEDIYVITLSSKLSGSYVSASIAAEIYKEDHDVNIHVFDSKSAASGQYAVYKYIEALCLEGVEFEEIVTRTEEFIKNLEAIFVFESLETLIKNGRVSKLKGKVAEALNIKPVLHGVDGEIHELDRGRGMNRALNAIVRQIDKQINSGRVIEVAYISECDALNRALNMKKLLQERLGVKEVVILRSRGLASSYAGRGGIIVAC